MTISATPTLVRRMVHEHLLFESFPEVHNLILEERARVVKLCDWLQLGLMLHLRTRLNLHTSVTTRRIRLLGGEKGIWISTGEKFGQRLQQTV